MNVFITHKGQRHNVVALLTKRIPFNVMSQTLFERLFGKDWLEISTPMILYKGAIMIKMDKVANIQIEIGKMIIRASVYINDEAMSMAMEPCDIIIGRETLEKYKIQVFE